MNCSSKRRGHTMFRVLIPRPSKADTLDVAPEEAEA